MAALAGIHLLKEPAQAERYEAVPPERATQAVPVRIQEPARLELDEPPVSKPMRCLKEREDLRSARIHNGTAKNRCVRHVVQCEPKSCEHVAVKSRRGRFRWILSPVVVQVFDEKARVRWRWMMITPRPAKRRPWHE